MLSEKVRNMRPLFRAAALACAALAAVFGSARADTAAIEAFYRNRTVTLLVATSPGGRYDVNARLIARHLGRFIPGNPNVVVQNTPGGGGLVLANRLYNTAEKDEIGRAHV